MKTVNGNWLFALLLLVSCEGEEISGWFDYTIEGDCSSPVYKILFQNHVEGASSYHWDFGDGTTSTEFQPIKIYDLAGGYSIRLTAYNGIQKSVFDDVIRVSRNSNGSGPSGEFTMDINYDQRSVTVTTLEPGEADFYLDFGDGSAPMYASEPIAITKIYTGPDRYTISLFVDNDQGGNCSKQTVDFGP